MTSDQSDFVEKVHQHLRLMAMQEREWAGPDDPDAKLFMIRETVNGGVIFAPLDIPEFAIKAAPSFLHFIHAFPEALRRWHVAVPGAVQTAIGDSFRGWVLRIEAYQKEAGATQEEVRKRLEGYQHGALKYDLEAQVVRQYSAAMPDGELMLATVPFADQAKVSSFVLRPGDEQYKFVRSMSEANIGLLRAARVIEWALGRWPRRD